jgi:hypothetical protein
MPQRAQRATEEEREKEQRKEYLFDMSSHIY